MVGSSIHSHKMQSAMHYTLYVDVNPVGWKAPTAFAKRMGGKVIAAAAPVPELVAYQEALRIEFLHLWGAIPAIETNSRVDLYFARRLETYVSSKSGRRVTKHRVDLTNLRKAAEDAMQPTIFKNDVFIVKGWTEIVEQSKDVEEPFVKVEIVVPA